MIDSLLLFPECFFLFCLKNGKVALFRRPAPGDVVDSCPNANLNILPDHESFQKENHLGKGPASLLSPTMYSLSSRVYF